MGKLFAFLSRTRATLVVAFAVVVVLWCPRALAQAAPAVATLSATDQAEAKRHVALAAKLFKQRLYEPAVVEYEAAFKLTHRAPELERMAECQRALNQLGAAVDTYTDLLALPGAKLSDREKKAIQKILGELGAQTGSIELTASQPGVTVSIDGRPVGTTPLAASAQAPSP